MLPRPALRVLADVALVEFEFQFGDVVDSSVQSLECHRGHAVGEVEHGQLRFPITLLFHKLNVFCCWVVSM